MELKVQGFYVETENGWNVKYRIEDGDEMHFEEVMLHPNTNNIVKNNPSWFIIKNCPNLYNGGEWELMAIPTVSDKLKEVAEKLKGKEIFKGLNDHARETLSQLTALPKPNSMIKTMDLSDDAILQNALLFTLGRVDKQGGLNAEEFTKIKKTFIHVVKWLRDNYKPLDEEFLTEQESKN